MNCDPLTKTVTITESDVKFLNMWREKYGPYAGFDMPNENNPSFFVDALMLAKDFTDDEKQKEKFDRALQALEDAETIEFDGSIKTIPDYMFDWGIDDNGKFPKHLILSEGVETVGKGAFNGCEIEDLNLPTSLKFVGEEAFRCTKIKHLEIPNNVELGKYSFADNGCLKTVIAENIRGERTAMAVEDGVLADSVFSSCSELKSFYASSPIWYFGPSSLSDNPSLEQLMVSGIRYISDGAFSGDESLKLESLNLSELEGIGNFAFSWAQCPNCLTVSKELAEEINSWTEEKKKSYCRNIGLSQEIDFVSSLGSVDKKRKTKLPVLPDSAFIFTEEENGIEL